MKSLVKAAALLVVAMPLFAADMNTTTTNGTSTAPTIDCSKMMGAAQDKCMKDLANCNAMTVAADKNKCMVDMNKAAANANSMNNMNNNMNNMNKNAQ